MSKNILPDFEFERKHNRSEFIGGADEVGRGALAGMVTAACVVFPPQISKSKFQMPNNIIINDSKKLTQKQREVADIWIKKNALAYGIGSASVAQINKLGIVKATNIAFRRAIKNCNCRIDYLLIDAFYIPYVKGIKQKKQTPIIKGDSKSVSIAAASIIAKVYRDKMMATLAQKPRYKKYLWHKNKGYGTLEHRKAIGKYGRTRLHRVSFLFKLP